MSHLSVKILCFISHKIDLFIFSFQLFALKKDDDRGPGLGKKMALEAMVVKAAEEGELEAALQKEGEGAIRVEDVAKATM